jgi:hypothetical protein
LSQSKLRYLLFVILGLMVLSACSLTGSSTGTANSATSTQPGTSGQPTGTAAANATMPASGTPAAVGTPDAVSLDPPLLVANTSSDTQKAHYGTFYWMISNGLAAQVNSRGIQIHDKALHVANGETVQFAWENQNSQSDSTLQDITLAVFPEDQSIVTQTSGSGTLKGFQAGDNPLKTDKLSTSDPSWKVDVGSGSYFVQVVANWSNPIVPGGKTRNCEYGFYITVG